MAIDAVVALDYILLIYACSILFFCVCRDFCLIFVSFIFNFKGDVVGGRLSASNRYRGSRESLQSGMTYSARKGSSSTLHNGTYSSIHFYFKLVIFILICFLMFCALYDLNFVILLDNDYYYGGSMRDLNNGYNRPRKASSVSHLGELSTDYERCLNSCQIVFGALERSRIHCVVN